MNTEPFKLGTTITQPDRWAIADRGGGITDIGRDMTEVQAALLNRMCCSWAKAYELGFRVVRISTSLKIIAVLTEDHSNQ